MKSYSTLAAQSFGLLTPEKECLWNDTVIFLASLGTKKSLGEELFVVCFLFAWERPYQWSKRDCHQTPRLSDPILDQSIPGGRIEFAVWSGHLE